MPPEPKFLSRCPLNHSKILAARCRRSVVSPQAPRGLGPPGRVAISLQKKRKPGGSHRASKRRNPSIFLVGARGFEPPTPRSRTEAPSAESRNEFRAICPQHTSSIQRLRGDPGATGRLSGHESTPEPRASSSSKPFTRIASSLARLRCRHHLRRVR